MKFKDAVTEVVAVKALPCTQPLEYGDLLVNVLNDYGVEYIFGIPGGGIEPLYNAMARSEKKGGLRSVVSRHESGAAFMADGYARESGKLGVCCTTTGPGATNILTGVASAYVDEVPMLVLTGQTRLANIGRGAAQDSSCDGVDVVAMFEHCTRYNSFVSHPDQLEEKLIKAISASLGKVPGPSHLSLPFDLLSAPQPSVKRFFPISPIELPEINPNNITMGKLKRVLTKSHKAVLVLGRGAEGAVKDIIRFAELRNWPLLTTPMGKGLIPADHPLYRGVYGIAGHISATEILQESSTELIIVVGSMLDESETQGWDFNGLLNDRLVHVDDNELHFYRSAMAKMHVYGSPRLVFRELNKHGAKRNVVPPTCEARGEGKLMNAEELPALNQCVSGKVPPQSLFSMLSEKAPLDTRVVVDIGNSFLWGIHYWQCRHKEGSYDNLFRLGYGFGPMGWGIGAAVGTAMANPKEPVICFTGDGSWLMNGQEITTAEQENLNVLFVVLNDQCLGTVRHGQKMAKAEATSFDLPRVDFAMLAQAYNVASQTIRTVSELLAFDLEAVFEVPGPYLLDVWIDGDQVPPLVSRVKAINEDQ